MPSSQDLVTLFLVLLVPQLCTYHYSRSGSLRGMRFSFRILQWLLVLSQLAILALLLYSQT